MQLFIPFDCFSYALIRRGTNPSKLTFTTSCAVNAGVVRWYLCRSQSNESRFGRSDETERMACILCLFEQKDVRNLVLGSFGTSIGWDLSVDARSKHPFDRVVLEKRYIHSFSIVIIHF